MTDAASTTDHITDPAAAEPTLEEHALTWEAITRAWVIALAALINIERQAAAHRPRIITPGAFLTDHIGRGIEITTEAKYPIETLFAHACRDGVVTEAELADAGNV